jgi:surface antigen
MKPFLFMKATSSVRIELTIVLGSLALIMLLPVLSVFILARTSLVTLAESAVDELYQGTISSTDTYDWGNCTYWAALLRQQAGDPIPNGWGNAADWAAHAVADGYVVNHVPSVGAIMQTSSVDHGLGHVAYVENVNAASGAWTISEMNVKGFDIVDTQTLSPTATSDFNFIHDKQ